MRFSAFTQKVNDSGSKISYTFGCSKTERRTKHGNRRRRILWHKFPVGTMVLAILAGFRRYCHIEQIRNDTACAELPGKQHSGRCGMPWLRSFLDSLPKSCWSRLLRGDVGYGNEEIMADAESRALRYLFKIKRSRNVRALFRRMECSGLWKDCGSGWQCVDTFISKADGKTTPISRCTRCRRIFLL